MVLTLCSNVFIYVHSYEEILAIVVRTLAVAPVAK